MNKLFELFDPKQILVLSYEKDVRPGEPAKNKVAQFLGVGKGYNTVGPFAQTNTHSSPDKVNKLPCSAVDQLWPLVEPWNQELYDLLASHERPPMETKPFPKFERPGCASD